MSRGLYIHIPFCLSKCPYCDFYSVKYNCETAEKYKDAVIRNLLCYNEKFDTVYFGGGTPVLLWKEICEILEHISLEENAEITVEANPCCSDKENLTALKKAGVNRISFGIQSLNDKELMALGRRHDAKTAVKAVETAYNCGFDNISADIMLGTQGQTVISVENTINELSLLPLCHISAYMLKIEENTPFAKMRLALPDEETVCDIYLSVVEQLENIGMHQYEISNFAVNGRECRHNLKYWNCEEYVGIGPAAHSYYKSERFFVDRNIDDFINTEFQATHKETDLAGGCDEYAMLRLRLTQGLTLSEYVKRGGNAEALERKLSLIPQHFFRFNGERLYLTPEGFLVSNSIIGTLLS